MQDSVYQKLAGNVRRLSRNHDVDAFHDAWLETGHANHRYLCARARLRVIDELRESRRAVPLQIAKKDVDDHRCPLTELINRELQSIVRFELGRLETLYREVAILHWIEEMSVIEISHKLRVPTKTVYTRLDRAKIHLRIMLQRVEDSR